MSSAHPVGQRTLPAAAAASSRGEVCAQEFACKNNQHVSGNAPLLFLSFAFFFFPPKQCNNSKLAFYVQKHRGMKRWCVEHYDDDGNDHIARSAYVHAEEGCVKRMDRLFSQPVLVSRMRAQEQNRRKKKTEFVIAKLPKPCLLQFWFLHLATTAVTRAAAQLLLGRKRGPQKAKLFI